MGAQAWVWLSFAQATGPAGPFIYLFIWLQSRSLNRNGKKTIGPPKFHPTREFYSPRIVKSGRISDMVFFGCGASETGHLSFTRCCSRGGSPVSAACWQFLLPLPSPVPSFQLTGILGLGLLGLPSLQDCACAPLPRVLFHQTATWRAPPSVRTSLQWRQLNQPFPSHPV